METVPGSSSGQWSAVEFFSGIGAFAAAAADRMIPVVGAFDQSAPANATYRENFGLEPSDRNLDTIRPEEIPAAPVWWLSPPCTPFSVRGKRRDADDPRAASLANLIVRACEVRPTAVLVENVLGFAGSRLHATLESRLSDAGFAVRGIQLCPTLFGVPMQRPRFFVVAVRGGAAGALEPPSPGPVAPLSSFLDRDPDPSLRVPDDLVRRYGRSFNVVEPDDPAARTICVTSGYARCMRASGSYLRLSGGGVRRFSPEELARLLGFPPSFRFPGSVDRATRWRLVGNSLDVRAARWLLAGLARGA